MESPELHAFLTGPLGLVAEPQHGGSWRTYFHDCVEWRPERTTRLLKVLADPAGAPSRIQLCVSSDPNNSVFLDAPFSEAVLRGAVEAETARLLIRLASNP